MTNKRRVLVKWDDATVLSGGWRDIAKTVRLAKETVPPRVTSLGFLLADDKHGIVIAASLHGDEAAGITIIPRGQIVTVKRL